MKKGFMGSGLKEGVSSHVIEFAQRENGSQDPLATVKTIPLLLKADEVARSLGLGRPKVYEMMAAGELPVVRIGTARRVPRAALLEWIERNTLKAA